jgi:hypothetical protein
MILDQAIKPLFAELKSNPRLRWGFWGIVGILWFYGVLELRDGVARQGEAYRAINRNIARTQAIASQSEWLSRLEEARSVQIDLERRLWRESTVGLAQATFHDWLSQVAQQASLARSQVTVVAQDEGTRVTKESTGTDSGQVSGTQRLWRISARLAFDFGPQSLYSLLARIASYEKKVVVESLLIRSAPSPRVDLVLVAYFQKTAPESAPEKEMQKGQRN